MAKKKSRTYVIDLEIEGGKEAESQLSAVNEELTEMSENGDSGVSILDELGGGFGNVAGKAKGVIGSVKGIVKGLGTLKGAIIATGVGAFIIALTSVTTWLNNTVEGSERLRQASSKLGGVWDEVKIKFAAAGESIVNAIDNPQEAWNDFRADLDKGVNVIKALFTLWINDWKIKTKLFQKGILEMRVKWNEFTGDAEEAEKLTEAIEGINEELKGLVKENVDAQITIAATAQETVNALKAEAEEYAKRQAQREELVNSTIELEKRERALTVATAEQRAEIERQKLIADDITKSEKERLAAANTAFALENNLMQEREALQKERIRLTKIEMETSLTSNEDLDRLAEQEAELARIQQESTTRQIELNNKRNAIEAEGARKRKEDDMEDARIAAEMEEVRFALIKEGIDKELAEVDRKYEELLLKANGNAELEKEIEEAKESEILAIRKKYRDEDDAAQAESNKKQLEDKFLKYDAEAKLAKQTVGSLAALAEAFADGEGKRAEAAFKVSKSLRLAEAAANTYTAVTAALADPAPGRIVRAIAAGAMGAAQITKIARTKFDGGGGGGGSISAPSTPISQQVQTTAPTAAIDFSFLENQPPQQAFVLSGNVQSGLEADQKVKDQATL